MLHHHLIRLEQTRQFIPVARRLSALCTVTFGHHNRRILEIQMRDKYPLFESSKTWVLMINGLGEIHQVFLAKLTFFQWYNLGDFRKSL